MRKELSQSSDTLEIQHVQTYNLIAAALGCLLGLMAVMVGIFTSSVLTGAIGIFFIIVCCFLAQAASARTTILHALEPCQVVTKRIITGRTLNQSFSASDLKQINFYNGFTENSWGNVRRTSDIYLVMNSRETILILRRYGIKPLSFFKANKPPVEEANQIASFLHKPLNTVDMVSLKGATKNFGDAVKAPLHDKTSIFFSPTAKEGEDLGNDGGKE